MPLYKNVISRFLLCGVADMISQYIEDKTLHPSRTLSFATYGGVSAPILFYSFRYLSPRFSPLQASFIQELIIWPVTCLPIYFLMYNISSSPSSPPNHILEKTKEDLIIKGPKTIIYSAGLWIPIGYAQYKYCPPWSQTYMRTVLATIYYIGLSYITHDSHIKESS